MSTALEMRPEERLKFNPARSILARREADRSVLEERRKKALQAARQAAAILKQQFGAEKVVLFGSLENKETFTKWSDIDIAAWGIPSDKFYKAVASITGLSSEYKIDLVEPDICRDSIKKAILNQGQEI